MPKHHKSKKTAKRKPLIPPATLRILLVVGAVSILLAGSGFTFAATQEAHNAFCASCHTEPESTFYARAVAGGEATDLATFHIQKETRCIDCHSGTGVLGRVSAELLGAHNALAFYTGTAVQPAKLTRPIGDPSCLKCHADVITGQATQNNHFHVFLARWQASDPQAANCTSCHESHTTDGEADIMYLNQTRTEAVCEACHRVMGD